MSAEGCVRRGVLTRIDHGDGVGESAIFDHVSIGLHTEWDGVRVFQMTLLQAECDSGGIQSCRRHVQHTNIFHCTE